MENLVLLVQRLLSKSDAGFPELEARWLQLVSYDEVSSVWEFTASDTPADDKRGLRKFFVYGAGTGYMTPARFEGASGILSHNSISNLATAAGSDVVDEDSHTDGSFQALYTWLRIMQSVDAGEAYANARDLVTNHVVKVTTLRQFEGYHRKAGAFVPYSALARRRIFLIDVESML